MSEEEDDLDIYQDRETEEAEENDEIDELEEGFIKGYQQDNVAECAVCGKILENTEDVVEIEFELEIYRFCSEDCAEQFKRKNQIE